MRAVRRACHGARAGRLQGCGLQQQPLPRTLYPAYTDALPCARSDACAMARELAGCRAAASSSGPATNPNPAYTEALPWARSDACAMARENSPAAGLRPPTAALPQALSPALYGRAAVRALGRVRHGVRAGRLQGRGLQQRPCHKP